MDGDGDAEILSLEERKSEMVGLPEGEKLSLTESDVDHSLVLVVDKLLLSVDDGEAEIDEELLGDQDQLPLLLVVIVVEVELVKLCVSDVDPLLDLVCDAVNDTAED